MYRSNSKGTYCLPRCGAESAIFWSWVEGVSLREKNMNDIMCMQHACMHVWRLKLDNVKVQILRQCWFTTTTTPNITWKRNCMIWKIHNASTCVLKTYEILNTFIWANTYGAKSQGNHTETWKWEEAVWDMRVPLSVLFLTKCSRSMSTNSPPEIGCLISLPLAVAHFHVFSIMSLM